MLAGGHEVLAVEVLLAGRGRRSGALEVSAALASLSARHGRRRRLTARVSARGRTRTRRLGGRAAEQMHHEAADLHLREREFVK